MQGQALQWAYVPLIGGAVGIYSGSTSSFRYRQPDWLGTMRTVSGATAGLTGDQAYAPFGETYASAGTPDNSFTGQDENINAGSSSGLYDFPFREYNPVSGRWISPDPAGMDAADPADPQTWNRYAYAANRPNDHIDPSGLFGLDAILVAVGEGNPLVGLVVDIGSIIGGLFGGGNSGPTIFDVIDRKVGSSGQVGQIAGPAGRYDAAAADCGECAGDTVGRGPWM